MVEDKYHVEYGADFRVFEFDSEGPNGKIRKIVQYSATKLKNFYNLALVTKILKQILLTI